MPSRCPLVGLPTPASAWFRDESPTPSAPNAAGAGLVSTYGTGTQLSGQLVQLPTLNASNSPTVAGNRDLVLSVDGTAGLPGETVFLVFSEGALATPLPVSGLDIWIDPGQVVLDMPGVAGVIGTTELFRLLAGARKRRRPDVLCPGRAVQPVDARDPRLDQRRFVHGWRLSRSAETVAQRHWGPAPLGLSRRVFG